ncbi:MAG: hypothetical protein RL199_1743, partial [Pseudomonadota bacterium]
MKDENLFLTEKSDFSAHLAKHLRSRQRREWAPNERGSGPEGRAG